MTTLTSAVRPVNRIFGQGIFDESPAPTTAPTRREMIAREVDQAWHLGHCLGRDGIDAEPCRDWKDHEKKAFRLGHQWGRIDRDADLQAEADEQDARLVAHLEEMEGSGLPAWQLDALGV